LQSGGAGLQQSLFANHVTSSEVRSKQKSSNTVLQSLTQIQHLQYSLRLPSLYHAKPKKSLHCLCAVFLCALHGFCIPLRKYNIISKEKITFENT